jgi:hypothetical protein
MLSETTIHVAIELSVSSWLVAARPPEARLHISVGLAKLACLEGPENWTSPIARSVAPSSKAPVAPVSEVIRPPSIRTHCAPLTGANPNKSVAALCLHRVSSRPLDKPLVQRDFLRFGSPMHQSCLRNPGEPGPLGLVSEVNNVSRV